ncbi:hypothetical protein B0H14DRAFT_3774439, partial [Mycena olivaceomarginata]
FDDLRNATPSGTAGNLERRAWGELTRKVIHDLATKMDRAMGSTTMVITTEGTTMPGTPPRSEFLKAHVCIPPSFLSENPGSRVAIATIVQLFIEHVGVPTVEAWTRRALARNWPLTQPGSTGLHVPVNPATLPLIPNPAPRSAYYVFRGRAAGYVPTGPVPTPGPPSSLLSAISSMGLVSDYEGMQAEMKAEMKELRDENLRLEKELRASHANVVQSPVRAHLRLPDPEFLPFRHGRPAARPQFDRRRPIWLLASPPPHQTHLVLMFLARKTHQFLIDTGLADHTDSISLICRFLSPIKWTGAVEDLACFPADAKVGLLAALERDGGSF